MYTFINYTIIEYAFTSTCAEINTSVYQHLEINICCITALISLLQRTGASKGQKFLNKNSYFYISTSLMFNDGCISYIINWYCNVECGLLSNWIYFLWWCRNKASEQSVQVLILQTAEKVCLCMHSGWQRAGSKNLRNYTCKDTD